MDNVFVGLGLTVIIALIVFTILVKLYEFFKNKKQNYPYEDEIEEIVLPFVYRGIFSAFKASEYFVDKFGNRLDGVDKKKLADSLYDLLPFSICVKGVTIPVKKLVDEEKFSSLVQSKYDEFLNFYKENELNFITMAEKWLKENKKEGE